MPAYWLSASMRRIGVSAVFAEFDVSVHSLKMAVPHISLLWKLITVECWCCLCMHLVFYKVMMMSPRVLVSVWLWPILSGIRHQRGITSYLVK